MHSPKALHREINTYHPPWLYMTTSTWVLKWHSPPWGRLVHIPAWHLRHLHHMLRVSCRATWSSQRSCIQLAAKQVQQGHPGTQSIDLHTLYTRHPTPTWTTHQWSGFSSQSICMALSSHSVAARSVFRKVQATAGLTWCYQPASHNEDHPISSRCHQCGWRVKWW